MATDFSEIGRQMPKCAICGNNENHTFLILREMMFGFRDKFNYFKCGKCECVQILDSNLDMAKYYPTKHYYSLYVKRTGDVKFFNNLFAKATYLGRGITYRLARRAGVLDRPLVSIRRENIPKDAHILDVGSGSGSLLQKLSNLGFQNLIGIDPYIQTELYIKKTRILNIDLQNLQSNLHFDCIMFHHSLEHMKDQLQALKLAKIHLAKEGVIIIRIPIVSYAFDKYGSNWYSLDSPRHIYINSLKSMKILASNAGLKMKSYYFDSGPEQFIFSESYASDIALSERPNEGFYRKIARNFLSPSYQKLRKESEKLNEIEKGDQAVFYLFA